MLRRQFLQFLATIPFFAEKNIFTKEITQELKPGDKVKGRRWFWTKSLTNESYEKVDKDYIGIITEKNTHILEQQKQKTKKEIYHVQITHYDKTGAITDIMPRTIAYDKQLTKIS